MRLKCANDAMVIGHISMVFGHVSMVVVVSTLVSINDVNLHRARLVLGLVTVSGFSSRYGTFISVCNQPPRPTQPGHLFLGRRNEYQPKGGDTLWLGSKGGCGSCVGGR